MSRWFVVVALLAGCPTTPPPECVTSDHKVDESCAPGYVPTFTNVYNNTLKQRCGSTQSGCHSAAGHAGGMSFATQDEAYTALLQGRVTPGDARCSEMIVRTNSVGEDYQMPPGDPLLPAAQCALVQWVVQGAQP